MNKFRKSIINSLNKILKKKIDESSLEIPPSQNMGDYAFPCFSLAKELKKSPNLIAKELKEKIHPDNNISETMVIGPYLNFSINKQALTKETLNEVFSKKQDYGKGAKKKYTVMIESPGPNTNKPLHLGHVRNMVLGNSLINLFNFCGYNTVRVDIINDRGIHICKSMLAYQKYGENKEPDKKTDHFVGDYYVLYGKKLKKLPRLEEQARKMLLDWENQDKKVRALWKKMNNWAIDGFRETYKRYGVKIDKPYPESEHYTKGKKTVLNGLKKRIFKSDEDKNIIADLEKYGLGKKVILRADGTSIYITQDMVLAKLRYQDYKMDKMIYIVGNEQIYHFKVLFKIFELLNYHFAKDCYHLAYGMIYLPEGKMKSREGTVVDADNLADEMHEIAKKEIKARYRKLMGKELEERSENIAMGAIKFYILKYDPMKDFTYNPEESISFEGETGPYLQYTHARINSILEKHEEQITNKIDFSLLKEEEQALVKYLSGFSQIIEKSAKEYKPSLLCRYLLDLAQSFNNYYHRYKVIQENKEIEKARILLIYCVKTVLKTGLNILGIEAVERM
ncbi:arginine--tRNA ligase [Candidatus Woesearchaeota archaeon]|nr:arginine--tRNA ligase [Candidatus Woesearchaeota archaeon]